MHSQVAGFFVYRHLGQVVCNIVLMKQILPLLILTGLLYGQDAVETPSIDSLSQFGTLEELEEQARMDAKEDFSIKLNRFSSKQNWRTDPFLISGLFVGTSVIILWNPFAGILASSIPMASSHIFPISMSTHLNKELNLQSVNHHEEYVISYKKEIKKFCMINSFIGSVYGVAVPMFVMLTKGGIPAGS